ncbi:DUF1116 domain-containing protein [Paenibacillus tepidiphilus]|uniref:DUF1116 domain-containing protein n=1 Tax=Paenibacillus tepidiphilus TaxID=2608683 RepID=UPI001239FF3E|nr:DUF1116 domain-containing protein [Paenibacillus tepidiphilus]
MGYSLFQEELNIINIGTSIFKDDLDVQRASSVQFSWKPPAGGSPALLQALDRVAEWEQIEAANRLAVQRIREAHPYLVDMGTALTSIPGMEPDLILHAGPPIAWKDMCGPMQGAIIGALLFEEKARNEAEARELAASGAVRFAPCNEYAAVGPMAGIISPSMPVHIIENREHGNKAYCTVNEGLGKVLRFGAFSGEVISRLNWIRDVFAPAIKRGLAESGGIDLKAITAQALHMGDECHNRNKAATSLFYKEISGHLLAAGLDGEGLRDTLAFIRNNDHYFLNLSMPACKAALDAGHGVEYSTIVTTMARNGVEFGIRVSGMQKDEWFTFAANKVQGLLFPGYTVDDAAPDLGDSAITETMGIGGFAMGGAPAIVQFVGGTVEDAVGYSAQMYEICAAENPQFTIPNLDFRGSALGIDIRKVLETGILPVINTGMAHQEAGVGQIGAGIVHPPQQCFEQALLAYASRYDGKE